MYLPTYSTIRQTPVLQELPRVARVVLTRDARWKGGGEGGGKGVKDSREMEDFEILNLEIF